MEDISLLHLKGNDRGLITDMPKHKSLKGMWFGTSERREQTNGRSSLVYARVLSYLFMYDSLYVENTSSKYTEALDNNLMHNMVNISNKKYR